MSDWIVCVYVSIHVHKVFMSTSIYLYRSSACMSVRLSSMYDDMMTGNKSYSYGPLGKLLSFSKNRMKPRRRRTRILYDPCLSPLPSQEVKGRPPPARPHTNCSSLSHTTLPGEGGGRGLVCGTAGFLRRGRRGKREKKEGVELSSA